MSQSPSPLTRKRPPTPGSWRPGVSGNPKGRPRKGNALTESIQAGCDPDELREIALKLARSAENESTQIAALNWLRDSGYTRPAEKHEIGPAGSMDDDDDALAELLTDAQLDQLDELDRRRAEILEAASRSRILDSGALPTAEAEILDGDALPVACERSSGDDDTRG